MGNPKGFAVIGTGLWGKLHARVYAESHLARLAAVCDVDLGRAREVGSEFGADAYSDHIEMLARDDIDAVSIVTPDFAHTQLALDAIAAGKHVLVEKPLAMSVPECERIIASAKAANVKLMVDFHNRWSPPFHKARAAIEGGEIGSVRLVYYRLNDTIFVPTKMLSWAAKTTVAWFVGSHAVDTVRWLLDDEAVSVYAVAPRNILRERGIDTPDFYEAVIEFAKGAIAVVENCWILPESTPNLIDLKCEVIGSSGALYLDTSHNRTLEQYSSGSGCYPDVLCLPEVFGKQMGFAAESIRHFIDCVARGLEPLAPGEDALEVTRVIAAMDESAASGERVFLRR